MMDFIIVLSMLLVAVLILICAVIFHKRKTEMDKCYAAAGNIIREDFLNYSLQNLMYPDTAVSEPKSRKTMVYIKTKTSGKNLKFVFDPEKGIFIGRDKKESNIYIDDVLISKKHCCIYSQEDEIYLQDMLSVNGIRLRRNLFKKYNISNGSRIKLRSGDRIFIGSCKFKVILFFYDITMA